MNRSFHFLVNPSSGGGAAPAAVLPVARLLRGAGARVDVSYSPGVSECRRLAVEAIGRGDVVVAVGGDGMVASLAGCVVDAGGVLGIVPSGRGNDFARQLRIPADPEPVAKTLLDAEPRSVDVIRAHTEGRSCVVVGSLYAGVDSRASELVDRAHRLPRAVQYPYAAVRALLTFDFPSYRIVLDGTEHRYEACTVVVANSGFYGAGMHIAPDASVTDGLLDVVVIRAASRLALVRSLPKLYDGSHVLLDDVLVLRGREVTIYAEPSVTAYGDGEPIAPVPVTASVQPGALSVLA